MDRKVRDTAGQEHNDMSYFAYLRVSTDKQDVKNNKSVIEKWLNGGNHTVKWYEDSGYSGSLPLRERPALKQCINDAKAAKGTIIVASLDRFGRKAWEVLQFFDQVVQKRKVNFICCDNPLISQNKMMLNMKAIFDEFTRDEIRRKTKESLDRINDEIKKTGKYITKSGKVIKKLGDHKNMDKARKKSAEKVKLTADQFAETLRPVLMDLRKRNFSYREMAEYLEAHSAVFEPRRKGKWNPSTVYYLIKRIEKGEKND